MNEITLNISETESDFKDKNIIEKHKKYIEVSGKISDEGKVVRKYKLVNIKDKSEKKERKQKP